MVLRFSFFTRSADVQKKEARMSTPNTAPTSCQDGQTKLSDLS